MNNSKLLSINVINLNFLSLLSIHKPIYSNVHSLISLYVILIILKHDLFLDDVYIQLIMNSTDLFQHSLLFTTSLNSLLSLFNIEITHNLFQALKFLFSQIYYLIYSISISISYFLHLHIIYHELMNLLKNNCSLIITIMVH